MTNINSLFIATGSNLGNREQNLSIAKTELQRHFKLIAESRIYESPAVDYLNQPDFYNQVLEFSLPQANTESIMALLLQIENKMGRDRIIPKGPRRIDLDILFCGELIINTDNLQIPHPRLFERSFVVLPLSELPGFKLLNEKFKFKIIFNNQAKAIS